MNEFVLDASVTLHWCFEDEASPSHEALLTVLQNQEGVAWVPNIWRYEVLNGLGKGVARARLSREKALLFWQEIQQLPIQIADIPGDQRLLDLSLRHNLSIYDASYLRLAAILAHPLATSDQKLATAAVAGGVSLIPA